MGMRPPPLPGSYHGQSERQWAARPATRTRRQWADFLVLWYEIHGATKWEWLRVGFSLLWLGVTRRLDKPRTIWLDPAAFGVKARPPAPPRGGTGMSGGPCEMIEDTAMGDLKRTFKPGLPIVLGGLPPDSGGWVLK